MIPLRAALPSQALVVLVVLAAATLAPPRQGAMLLIPIDGDAGAAVRTAVAAGAALVRTGPWPGSVVMWGTRARLAGPLRRARVLMLAAPPGGCGAGEAERA